MPENGNRGGRGQGGWRGKSSCWGPQKIVNVFHSSLQCKRQYLLIVLNKVPTTWPLVFLPESIMSDKCAWNTYIVHSSLFCYPCLIFLFPVSWFSSFLMYVRLFFTCRLQKHAEQKHFFKQNVFFKYWIVIQIERGWLPVMMLLLSRKSTMSWCYCLKLEHLC